MMEDATDQHEALTEGVDVSEAAESLNASDSGVEQHGEDEEFDEEDVWITEEIERQERELQEEEGVDGERYVPQLMDTLEMRALQSALRRTEVQFEREGRMREYTARRPATSSETTVNAHTRPRHSSAASFHYLMTTSDAQAPPSLQSAVPGRDDGSLAARSEPVGGHSRPLSPRSAMAPSAQKRIELAQSLRVELRQVRALEQRYSEMKRVLLDHVEMICSSKLHDRVGSPETFEQLAELMAFANQCAASLSTVK